VNKEYFDSLAAQLTAGMKRYEQYLKDIDFFGQDHPMRGALNSDDVRHNLVNDVDEGDCDYCGEDFSDLVKLDPDDLLRELVGITDEESDLYINTYTTELDEVTVVVSDDDDNARIFRVTIEEI
jgi:hypothetical protein